MINYHRSAFGLNLISRIHGSAVYRSFIPALFSVTFFLMLRWFVYRDVIQVDPDAPPSLEHPYAIGVVVSGITFLIIFRASQGYSRYWEAVSAVYQMQSKWMDATIHTACYHMQCDHYKDIMPPSFFDYPHLNAQFLTRDRERIRGAHLPYNSAHHDHNKGIMSSNRATARSINAIHPSRQLKPRQQQQQQSSSQDQQRRRHRRRQSQQQESQQQTQQQTKFGGRGQEQSKVSSNQRRNETRLESAMKSTRRLMAPNISNKGSSSNSDNSSDEGGLLQRQISSKQVESASAFHEEQMNKHRQKALKDAKSDMMQKRSNNNTIPSYTSTRNRLVEEYATASDSKKRKLVEDGTVVISPSNSDPTDGDENNGINNNVVVGGGDVHSRSNRPSGMGFSIVDFEYNDIREENDDDDDDEGRINNTDDFSDSEHEEDKKNPTFLAGRARLDGNWGPLFKDGKATFYNRKKFFAMEEHNDDHHPLLPDGVDKDETGYGDENDFLHDRQGFASLAGGRTPPLFLQELAHLSSLLTAVALSTLRNDVDGAQSPLDLYHIGSPWPAVDPADIPELWDSTSSNTKSNSKFINMYFWYFIGMGRTPEERTRYNASRPLPVLGGVSDNEIAFLQMARGPYAKTQLCWNWLSEFITREHLRGSTGKVGPPIISRIIQFLGDGMISYNHARKIMATPFPFPHAQLSAVFTLVMIPLIPYLMDQYCDELWLGCTLTFLSVTCLSGIHEVARELENPFRNVPNELPLVTYMAEFNETLITMYSGYHPDFFWEAPKQDVDTNGNDNDDDNHDNHVESKSTSSSSSTTKKKKETSDTTDSTTATTVNTTPTSSSSTKTSTAVRFANNNNQNNNDDDDNDDKKPTGTTTTTTITTSSSSPSSSENHHEQRLDQLQLIVEQQSQMIQMMVQEQRRLNQLLTSSSQQPQQQQQQK